MRLGGVLRRSQLFLVSGGFIIVAAIAFWVTSGQEEIDSLVDPVAERERARLSGNAVPIAERPGAVTAEGEPADGAVEPKENPVANGSVTQL